MFNSRTLFVIGAGASAEAGLPTGEALKQKIAALVNLKLEEFSSRLSSGDRKILQALQFEARGEDGRATDINPYIYAGRKIHSAMPNSISIDNFLDAHQGDKKIELCGKLGIVRSILSAEQNSSLYFSPSYADNSIDYGRLGATWFVSFMKLLTEGVRASDVVDLFKNVSVVSFNYDRTIEHFLMDAIQKYYSVSDNDAAELIDGLDIYHPYGTVGDLPWQNPSDSAGYGADLHPERLLDAAKKILTFSERIEDEASISSIRQLVQEAEVIVFLGFAFHEQNMGLLRPNEAITAKRVFATASGISASDCEFVHAQIEDFCDPLFSDPKIDLRNDLECRGLFDEYWRSLKF